MRFNIKNQLVFIDSFQLLRLSLDILVKNLSKDDFKYLSRKFDNNALDLLLSERYFILISTWVVLKSLTKTCLANEVL